MAWIEVDRITVRFPIQSSASMSLKRHLGSLLTGMNGGSKPRSKVVTALEDVSFELREGDRVGIIGSNGSGKTTLLRALSGIYEPSVGEVRVNGKISALMDLALDFDMEATGHENIALRAYALGVTRRELQLLMPDIVAFTELGDRLDDPIVTYSAGMMLRLAFSTSLHCPHEIMLIDEIIGVGDAAFLAKTREKLLATIEQSKIVAVASHALDLIQLICNKALYLQDGRIRGFGPVDDVVRLYRDDGLAEQAKHG